VLNNKTKSAGTTVYQNKTPDSQFATVLKTYQPDSKSISTAYIQQPAASPALNINQK